MGAADNCPCSFSTLTDGPEKISLECPVHASADAWQITIGLAEGGPAILCANELCGCQLIGTAEFHRDPRVILYAGTIEAEAFDQELHRHIDRMNG